VQVDHAARTVRLTALGKSWDGGNEGLVVCENNLRKLQAALFAEQPVDEAIKFPDTWGPGPVDATTPCDPAISAWVVDVQPGSKEWAQVLAEFQGTANVQLGAGGHPLGDAAAMCQGAKPFACTLLRVRRLHNPMAWTAFHYRLRIVAGQNKSADAHDSLFKKANTFWMKHGTSATPPALVAASNCGLNPNFCESGMYGRAAYTAAAAAYSNSYAHGTTHTDGAPAKEMLLVRVIAGNFKEFTDNSSCTAFKEAPKGYHTVFGNVRSDAEAFNGKYMALMAYIADFVYPVSAACALTAGF